MSYSQQATIFANGLFTPPSGARYVLYTVPAGKFARVRYFQASFYGSGTHQLWIGEYSAGQDIAYVNIISAPAPSLTAAWKGWHYVAAGNSLAFWCSGSAPTYVVASGELVTN